MKRLSYFAGLVCALVLVASAAAANISCNGSGPCAGTSGHDTISGNPQFNNIDAKAGNDLVFAKEGGDIVKAGMGHDKVYGGTGFDDITGGSENDVLFGGCNGGCASGPGTFYGGDGGDTIGAANGYYDDVDCGPGNDTAWVDWDDDWVNCEVRHIQHVGYTTTEYDEFNEEPTVSTDSP